MCFALFGRNPAGLPACIENGEGLSSECGKLATKAESKCILEVHDLVYHCVTTSFIFHIVVFEGQS